MNEDIIELNLSDYDADSCCFYNPLTDPVLAGGTLVRKAVVFTKATEVPADSVFMSPVIFEAGAKIAPRCFFANTVRFRGPASIAHSCTFRGAVRAMDEITVDTGTYFHCLHSSKVVESKTGGVRISQPDLLGGVNFNGIRGEYLMVSGIGGLYSPVIFIIPPSGNADEIWVDCPYYFWGPLREFPALLGMDDIPYDKIALTMDSLVDISKWVLAQASEECGKPSYKALDAGSGCGGAWVRAPVVRLVFTRAEFDKCTHGGEPVYLTPNDCVHCGTPVCSICGEDMAYSHTEVYHP